MLWKTLNLILTRWTSIKRWNNFPRIEDISHMDNIWFVVHVALFLAHLEEENWGKVDELFIIKRIIFDSFGSLILSDIISGTKDYIKQIDKKLFEKLTNKVFNYMFQFEAPEYIKLDIKKTISNQNKSKELQIIKAAKKYAWYIEWSINSRVFNNVYDVVLLEIEEYLAEAREELKSLDILLDNENYKKYLSHIRRLSHIKRWNQAIRKYDTSVISHLVFTAFLAYIITSIENNEWANYDMLEIMKRALYHDIAEAITGDIIAPTKKAVIWFEELLEKVEITMLDDYLFHYVWKKYKYKIKDYILSPWKWKEGKITKYADNLSALFEAKEEVNSQNQLFDGIYKKIKKQLNNVEISSINYILKYVLDSFDEDIGDIDLSKF